MGKLSSVVSQVPIRRLNVIVVDQGVSLPRFVLIEADPCRPGPFVTKNPVEKERNTSTYGFRIRNTRGLTRCNGLRDKALTV
jgi:hypothetical protein